MNGSAPVNAGGWMSAAGYRFFLRGDVELKDLFRLENVLALPVARPAAEGSAKLDVNVSGPWQGFAAAVTRWQRSVAQRARRDARPEHAD